MKKIITSSLISMFALSSFADIIVDQDKTVTDAESWAIKFTKPNTTLTINGEVRSLWFAPRADFGSDYVYSEGDKVTVELSDGGSLVLNASGGNALFGGDSVSPSKADMVITGMGTVYTTLSSIKTENTVSKLYLDAFTDFSAAKYTIGAKTNLTLSNTLNVQTMDLNSGSVFTMSSDNDSAGCVYATGDVNVYGSIILKSDENEFVVDNATTHLYGTLDLASSNGFRTRWLTVHNGSTIIVRADNALMESDGVARVFSMAKDAISTLKLYADQEFALLYFADNNVNGTLNAYTNGNALTFSGINANGILNIFIEEGFSWENDKIRFTNATVEKVTSILGSITVGDTVIDESFWDIVSDGANGVYINLTTVPEPAEWAVIFGAIALGFVAYRRRK